VKGGKARPSRSIKNISGIFAGNISGRVAKINFATRPLLSAVFLL
jgi:hypothetical protein